MQAPNIIGEAAKSPLGIVALFFVIAGSLARAFFGSKTPVRVRIIMFVVVLVGLAGFTTAVLRINMPEPVVEVYGKKLPEKRATELVNLQDKFKTILVASQAANDNATKEMARRVEEANPVRGASNFVLVSQAALVQAHSYIDHFQNDCNEFDQHLKELKVDSPDMNDLIEQREKELGACRQGLSDLKQHITEIEDPNH